MTSTTCRAGILLSQPLASTADDNLLVRSSGLSGDEAHLVVRYEYTPGFEELDAVAVGGQGHYWFGDHVRLGLTANSNEEGDVDSNLGAADLTMRMSPNSWLKVQTGRSEGLVASSLRSEDGGFGFQGPDPLSFSEAEANAYRADVSVGLGDFFDGRDGRANLYVQNLEAGYSAPGQATIKETQTYGGIFRMPVTNRLSLAAKGDQRSEEQGLETRTIELDLGYKMTDRWTVSGGVRNDSREDRSPVVPLTQEQGDRTDAVAQVKFDAGASWRAYGFVQETVSADEGREDNGRIGVGGSYHATKRFRVDAEVSEGDLGAGGRLGTNYLVSERTSLYLNYALENERTDNGLNIRKGTLVSGVRRRLTDASSVYLEERYQDSEALSGLTHAGWNQPGGEGALESRRQRRVRHADQRSDGRRDRPPGSRSPHGLRLGKDPVRERGRVSPGRRGAARPDAYRAQRMALPQQLQVPAIAGLARAGVVEPLVQRQLAGRVLRRRLHGGRVRLRVPSGAPRPVERPGQVHVLLQRSLSGPGGTLRTPRPTSSRRATSRRSISPTTSRPSGPLGGKYAHRVGEVSLDRVNRNFFDNAAHLGVLRADWRFHKGWESLVEARMLDLSDLDQKRTGALGAVYRYFGKNLKVGVGYNFTDFSDDLTDLSYDHKGAFFNIVGSK